MFEKVNPAHPDKIADRIAGALVDYAYSKEENPKIAVEVLIGHGDCFIIAESSVSIQDNEVENIVRRIAGECDVFYYDLPQDPLLAKNQDRKIRCGDNGIFKGMPITDEQKCLSNAVKQLYNRFPSDGKYILHENRLIACQSNVPEDCNFEEYVKTKIRLDNVNVYANPLGYWTGGLKVDTGATNRKLGSDMGDAVTGGGLHGKDLSKADVSVNIYAHVRAQQIGKPVELHCAIGDEYVDGLPYSAIVEVAKNYIWYMGGFEKFAEWGLI